MTNRTAAIATRRSPLAVALLAGAAVSMGWASAAWGGELPLTEITLYRSGVGAFSHNGTVTGDESVELEFGVERVNDILKSMVCLDYSGGSIGGVVYEPSRSVEDRLKDFTINPRQAQSMAGLMMALIGEPIELSVAEGDTISGKVLGVESRAVTNPGAPENASEHWASLLTGAGIRAVPLVSIRSMTILNEDLREELEKGLAAIAEHRSDTSTGVDVLFNGNGERRVSVVYTHSAPVWKVSYRLVLPESPGDEPYLQGWAIVENDTDADWEGVRLSLASGRPVSFVMDLQTPLNLRRPNVAVPVLAGLGPVVYESTMPGSELAQMESLRSNGATGFARRSGAMADSAMELEADDAMAPKMSFDGGARMQEALALAGSNATAGEAGEQFVYDIDAPVFIERGKSAMLPILGQPIVGRRLTIFSPSSGVDRPMRGVELTNDTGLHLPPGPIAVYDADTYAGDAQIRHTSRDQKRLLSYAVDLDVDVNTEHKGGNRVLKVKVVDGMIVETYERTDTTTYTAVNRDTKRSRSVMIERPRMNGWDLISKVKPSETTEHADRYVVELEPGESKGLVVEFQRTDQSRVQMLGYDLTRLLAYQTNGAASKQVVEGIRKAADFQGQINQIQSQLSALRTEQNEIAQDQDRIRRNMGSVQRGTDLHTRYVQKLNEQEDRLETLLETRESLETQLDATQRELDAYIRGLNLG